MAAWDRIISALLQFNIQFGWRDLVDIIIVAYVFYRLILIIRGTRAEQLIKGVVLLLVAMIASDIVGFNTLHWLLKSVMTVGLIAIPIVFQPELRRALEHLGRGKLFQRSYWNPQEFDHLLEELTKAILVLVKKADRRLDYYRTGIGTQGVYRNGNSHRRSDLR